MVGQIGRPLLIEGVYSFNSAIPLVLLTSSSEESIASRVHSDRGLEAQQATEVIWARSSAQGLKEASSNKNTSAWLLVLPCISLEKYKDLNFCFSLILKIGVAVCPAVQKCSVFPSVFA